MKVLIACEFSGIVREAFRKRGHDAWSCDLLPAEDDSEFHIQGEIGTYEYASPNYLGIVQATDWDMIIAFPPCTHLAVSGARWFKGKECEQAAAIQFARLLMNAPVTYSAVENPIGVLSTAIRKPDQIIQPWQFGHGETKATCLWLRRLPALKPTKIVEGRSARIHREPPGPERWKNRSRSYQGIADAMADQWGNL
jgi:hypothetical protein